MLPKIEKALQVAKAADVNVILKQAELSWLLRRIKELEQQNEEYVQIIDELARKVKEDE